MKENKKLFTVYDLVTIGFMAALVFVASKLSIPISTGIDNTRIHFGNIFCLLAGLLFGPVRGGLAAGFGSMLFDLTDPLYVATAPLTFIFKFLMGYTAGKISYLKRFQGKHIGINFLAAAVGQIVYLILYLGKGFIEARYFLQVAMEPALISVATKAVVSGINAVFAVVIAVPLMMALKKALGYTAFYRRLMGRYLSATDVASSN